MSAAALLAQSSYGKRGRSRRRSVKPRLPLVEFRTGLPGALFAVELPIHTISEANQREDWRVRHGRRQRQRDDVKALLGGASFPPLPLTVTLTRLAPPRNQIRDKHDNLAMSCKAVVDELAKLIGVDDSDKRITWRVLQEKASGFGVRVEMEPRS